MGKQCKYKPGDVFGKWTLISSLRGNYWRARCACGIEKEVIMSHLSRGKSKSCRTCGGVSRAKHGLTGSAEYTAWASMRSRCLNHNDERYHQYGGRGIAICKSWGKFSNFLNDMGERPHGTSLDRIDVDGNYEPSNCRWATPKQQMRNLRIHKDKPCVKALSEQTGVNYGALQTRLFRGWSYDRAISEKIHDKAQSVSALARKAGLEPGTVLTRISRGMSVDQALSTPVKFTRKKS